jgi:polysaccharide biosynthesis transport protein
MNQQAPSPDRLSAPDPAPAVDVWRYLGIIRKRAWIIAAVVAVGMTMAVLYTKRQARIYRATASVVIDPTPPQVFGSQVQEVIQLGAGSYWSNQEYYNTQLQVITKYELAERTIRKDQILGARLLGLPEGTRELDPEQLRVATEALTGMLSASQNRESRITNVHVQHTDPDLAVDLANAQVDTYYEHSRKIRGQDGREITRFLEDELDRAEKELKRSEEKLLAFKKDNDILSVSLEDKQSMLAADLARYTAATSDARIKRIEIDAVRKRAQGLKGEDVMESPIFALASNSKVVDAVKEQYMLEKQRLAELGQEIGPRHPQYLSQQKKVAEQLSALQVEAKRAMREIDERYQSVLASEQQFAAEIERLKNEAFELGPKALEYNQYKREFENDEEKYKVVLGRLRASRLTERNEATNVSQHARARQAVLVYPRLGVNLAIAGLLSLMIGLGLAFLLDLLDRTIKSVADIERVVDAPLLGTIPLVQEQDLVSEDSEGKHRGREELPVDLPAAVDLDPIDQALRDRDLYVFRNQRSPVAEHCRSIRTNILFSSVSRPMKTLTISSPQKGEGKTTSTIYLGTIMAQSNQRVLLVDTDMRRPRLHKSLLGVKRVDRGLSNLFLPDTNVDELIDQVIQPTGIPNLSVLPCGPKPPNPAELLLTERFKEILVKLEERFDRILLDSPPLLVMNDAVVLSRLSDGVVMVAQAGKTSIDHVARSARMIHDINAPILGVILNDVDPMDSRYGNYYYNDDYYDTSTEPAPGPREQARSAG